MMIDGLRIRTDTTDPDEARTQLTSAYCPHRLTVGGSASAFRARHADGGTTALGVNSTSFGAATAWVNPLPFDDFVLVSQQISGRFVARAESGERLVSPGEHVVLDAHTVYQLRWEENCTLFNVRLPRSEFETTFAELTGAGESDAIRFPLSWHPSERGTMAVQKVTHFLLRNAGPSGLLASGALLRGQLVRMLVASIIEAYGPAVRTAGARSSGDVRPPAVRRAMAYLEDAAAEDVRISDVAAAARLSTRALQEAFRQYLDTTPMAYLKSVRLARAHTDLRQASVDGGVTVAAVAYRWGFANLGRFAADYRRKFGRSPGEVLRAAR
jgi:AraC-like DNA-binding protein